MTARRGLALGGVALALALIAGRVLAGAYADWAWYGALGAGSLWSVRLVVLTALRGGLFAVAFAFSFANLLAMRRSIVSLVLPRRLGNLEIGEAVPGRALTAAAALLSLLIAAALALPQDDWVGLLRAHWATPLGESDPYVGRDMAFWMGWLPFERSLHAWCVMLAVVVGATVLVLYGLTPSVRVLQGKVHVSTWVRRHFSIYSAILLLLVAWGFRLDAFDLFIHGSGIRETFVAFDHRVMYPYLIALGMGTAAVGLLVAWTGWMGHQRATLGALLLVLVAGPLGRLGLPLLDRRAAGQRERAALDRPYLHVRALYTRRAYRVDEIVRGATADSLRVPENAIARSASSWDPAALARAATDEPSMVSLEDAGSWRVLSNGGLRASVVFGGGPDASRAQLAVQDVDPTDADARGAPWPAALQGPLSVPPIAVGSGFLPVLLVADTLGRLAAPTFPSGWRRLALAWSVRNLRLAMSDVDPVRTRLLVRRNVRERVQTLLPFFTTGPTPQALIVRDSLWWTLELFNASPDYPLTEPLILAGEPQHHAVAAGVALVNAHSGRVQVLLPESPDKMTRWWRNHLPELFAARQSIAPDLLAALPAPVDLAMVQGSALARTGFRNDTLSARPLFQADDADLDLLPGAPTPFVSGAPGHPLAWGVPAVDGTDRVRGTFVAVGGAGQRTALVEQPDSVRWSAALDRLQRTADSARISQSRRHPRRGRVQVIPTSRGLLVLQAFYEWPPEREPSLAGVVALHAGQARVGTSVAVAFGAPAHPANADARLRLAISRVHAAMQAALREGDWVAFGRAMTELKRLASAR